MIGFMASLERGPHGDGKRRDDNQIINASFQVSAAEIARGARETTAGGMS